jgi:hypothetical protein
MNNDGRIEVLSQKLHGGTEKIHEHVRECYGGYSRLTCPGNLSTALPLRESTRLKKIMAIMVTITTIMIDSYDYGGNDDDDCVKPTDEELLGQICL